jgi:hypothetical protein
MILKVSPSARDEAALSERSSPKSMPGGVWKEENFSYYLSIIGT